MEENVTFSGKEARPLPPEAVGNMFHLLGQFSTDFKLMPSAIHENTQGKLARALLKAIDQEQGSIPPVDLSAFNGMPIIEKRYIPLGEFWFMNPDGTVISKFKI